VYGRFSSAKIARCRSVRENRRDAHSFAVDFISQTIGYGLHGVLGCGVLADSSRGLKSLCRVDAHNLPFGPDEEMLQMLNERIRPHDIGCHLMGKGRQYRL
jgi:hypothetical protein